MIDFVSKPNLIRADIELVNAGKRKIIPEDWLANKYDVKMSLPQLWMMGSSFDWTLECTELLVRPNDAEGPLQRPNAK